jgi:nitrous oxide reductase accessory protein NosL
LTPIQIKMKQILQQKGQMIVDKLLDCMGPKNQDDLESTLNASTILLDFCENEQCFNYLTTPESMKKLIH